MSNNFYENQIDICTILYYVFEDNYRVWSTLLSEVIYQIHSTKKWVDNYQVFKFHPYFYIKVSP